MKKIFLLSIVLLLSACGSKIEGTYVSDRTLESLTFKSNGTVTEMIADMKVGDFPYQVNGDQIKIDGLTTSFILKKDGSIDGGIIHGRFTKK